MNIKNFDNYDDMFISVVSQFNSLKSVSVICDYIMAEELLSSVNLEDYQEYIGIDLQSDVEKYVVSRCGNEYLCIEPIFRDGRLIYGEDDNIIILDNVYTKEIDSSFQADFSKELYRVEV